MAMEIDIAQNRIFAGAVRGWVGRKIIPRLSMGLRYLSRMAYTHLCVGVIHYFIIDDLSIRCIHI